MELSKQEMELSLLFLDLDGKVMSMQHYLILPNKLVTRAREVTKEKPPNTEQQAESDEDHKYQARVISHTVQLWITNESLV